MSTTHGPQPVVPLEELSWQDHLDQLLFFVKSPTLLGQAVLPAMKERGRGRIVQIGSDIFERAVPGMSAYVAAKGAQLGLTRSWARELGPFGITVNYVAATGWIQVEMQAGLAGPTSLRPGSARPGAARPDGSAGRRRRGRVVPRRRFFGILVAGERLTVNRSRIIDSTCSRKGAGFHRRNGLRDRLRQPGGRAPRDPCPARAAAFRSKEAGRAPSSVGVKQRLDMSLGEASGRVSCCALAVVTLRRLAPFNCYCYECNCSQQSACAFMDAVGQAEGHRRGPPVVHAGRRRPGCLAA